MLIQPLYYNIFVCPHCGFSVFRGFFPVLPPHYNGNHFGKSQLPLGSHHFSKERSIKDAINTYKLASYCGALKKEKHIILAGICLRIAWLYRIKPKQGTRRKIFLVRPRGI
jgi:uncharacterized protein (DUF2225 family)